MIRWGLRPSEPVRLIPSAAIALLWHRRAAERKPWGPLPAPFPPGYVPKPREVTA